MKQQFYFDRLFEIRRRRFANFSPGLGAQRQPWDPFLYLVSTLKWLGKRLTLSGFSMYLNLIPGVVACAPTPG
jgi:hypothetical protein